MCENRIPIVIKDINKIIRDIKKIEELICKPTVNCMIQSVENMCSIQTDAQMDQEIDIRLLKSPDMTITEMKKNEPNLHIILSYLEYWTNIIWVIERCLSENEELLVHECYQFKEKVFQLINALGYENYYCKKEKKILLIRRMTTLVALSEIWNYRDLDYIFKYSHFTTEHDIYKKWKLLLQMEKYFAVNIRQIEEINKAIKEDVQFLLKVLKSYFNNEKMPLYEELMNNDDEIVPQIEYWCDETYQMLLLSFIEMYYSDRIICNRELRKRRLGKKA